MLAKLLIINFYYYNIQIHLKHFVDCVVMNHDHDIVVTEAIVEVAADYFIKFGTDNFNDSNQLHWNKLFYEKSLDNRIDWRSNTNGLGKEVDTKRITRII